MLVFPGPASAGIDPASYQHVDVIHDYGPNGVAGGFISCPAGTKAVASGATSSGPFDRLTAGFTAFDENGAFATGGGNGDGRLQISARCVEATQVAGSTLATTAVRDHRPTAFYHSGRASCPPGTVAYGGGGFFSQPGGSQPFGSNFVYASMPDADGTGWFVAAGGSLLPDKEMWISTHCLPRGQFGQIVTVIATDTAPPGDPSFPNYPRLFAAARCPFGFAYAGGAWLHRVGSATAEWVGYLTVSNMSADNKGWFAAGYTFADGAELTATVQCMTLRID
jgi:hypothetical protein